MSTLSPEEERRRWCVEHIEWILTSHKAEPPEMEEAVERLERYLITGSFDAARSEDSNMSTAYMSAYVSGRVVGG